MSFTNRNESTLNGYQGDSGGLSHSRAAGKKELLQTMVTITTIVAEAASRGLPLAKLARLADVRASRLYTSAKLTSAEKQRLRRVLDEYQSLGAPAA